MSKKRKQDVSEELYNLARSGASVHQICASIRTITYAQAEQAVQQVAEDNKISGPAHRANLRNLIREQSTTALKIISQIAKDESQSAIVRLRAAETLLKYACDFIDESVMRSWQERPDTSVELQPTLFDFGPVIEANGEISFRGETKLILIEPKDD